MFIDGGSSQMIEMILVGDENTFLYIGAIFSINVASKLSLFCNNIDFEINKKIPLRFEDFLFLPFSQQRNKNEVLTVINALFSRLELALACEMFFQLVSSGSNTKNKVFANVIMRRLEDCHCFDLRQRLIYFKGSCI